MFILEERKVQVLELLIFLCVPQSLNTTAYLGVYPLHKRFFKIETAFMSIEKEDEEGDEIIQSPRKAPLKVSCPVHFSYSAHLVFASQRGEFWPLHPTLCLHLLLP